jgi:Spy/CpxP family protein refolding chaperone
MMSRQFFSMVTGAILIVAPLFATYSNAQAAPTGNRMERSAQRKQFQTQLNLTASQKAQLREIRTQSRAQMEAVLTDAQKTQLKTMKASGAQGGERGGWKQLGLTAEQKTQLKKIRESGKARQEAVYTSEQKALMAKYRAENPRKAKSARTT